MKAELVTFQSAKDLTGLLSASGPCLSVYMPLARDKENALRWRECLSLVDDRLPAFGGEGQQLVESVRDWSAFAPNDLASASNARSVAVFRSSENLSVTLLHGEVQNLATLTPAFYIRPLLLELSTGTNFYLLALSQKNTRLLHCTLDTSEEIALTAETKTDFDEWQNLVKPDHNLVSNAMAAGAQGSMGPSALAPKGADQEAKNEHLSHYFKQVNRGITETLRGKTDPLVLCAVDYELALYRNVNTYGHLARVDVHGAANGLKAGEMHARAIQALHGDYALRLDEALADWNHCAGSKGTSRLKEVVTAAHDGRVLNLFISDSQERMGAFDEATHTARAGGSDEPGDGDLLNEAAVQTLLHAGNVFVTPNNKMPNGSAAAATFRF